MALPDGDHVCVVEAESVTELVTKGTQAKAVPPPDITWKKLQPLKTELLPVKSLTPEMLPEEVSGWLVDVCARMDNAPYEYTAVSAIVILSSLLGRKAGIRPKRNDDWLVISNLWGCCIGRPGTKKTPVMNAILRSLKRMENLAREDYQWQCKQFEADQKLCVLENKEAEKKAKKLIADGKRHDAAALLMDDSSDMEKPTCRRFIVHDSSVEKLGIILSQNPWGILLFRDELAGWMTSLNRDDRSSDRAFWLESYNGDGSFSYDRITRDDIYLESNTVAILGGIQPGKLLPLLMEQRKGAGDDGLLERFQLMVYPDATHFSYTDQSPDLEKKRLAEAVFERFKSLDYEPDERDRPALHFDDDAQQLFNEWYCQIMQRIQSGELSQSMESHLSKYPSLMASLALIFHCIRHGATGRVGLDATEKAIQWCSVLETHAARVYALIDDPLSGAKILIEKLDKLGAGFKMDDLQHKGWSGLKETADRRQAVYWLEQYGYIARHEHSSGQGRPSVTYYVNPACMGDAKEQ